MFRDAIAVPSKAVGGGASTRQVVPASLFKRISRAKYPALTAEEEAASLPLQTLALSIFDAIMVHMMSEIAAESWQPLREELCGALNARKPQRTLEIVGTYTGGGGGSAGRARADHAAAAVVCLQETSAYFLGLLRSPEHSAYAPWIAEYKVLSPAGSGGGGQRDQNSLILLRRADWDAEDAVDVTTQVEAAARTLLSHSSSAGQGQGPSDVVLPWSSGDLLAVLVTRRGAETGEERHLIASFHGDTNGLATIPMIRALLETRAALSFLPAARVLVGLDANAYEHPKDDGWLGVRELERELKQSGLATNWQPPPPPDAGEAPQPIGAQLYYTTFNARTFLQPQLNKAVRRDERATKGDHNPKDFVLFDATAFAPTSTSRDNTGRGPGGEYEEATVFPTLQFPSDHALVATTLVER